MSSSVSRTRWISLVTVLGNQNLDWLAVNAAQICLKLGRFLSAKRLGNQSQLTNVLDLFVDHQSEILVLYDKSAVRVLERQLSVNNVDWIQVAEHLGFRGSKVVSSLIRALREKPELTRNRVLVVNSYLLKFMFADRPEGIQGNLAVSTRHQLITRFGLLQQFQRLSMQQELALHGLNVSSRIIDSPEKFMDLLVSHLTSPSIVASCCRCFGKKLESTLLLYAVNLCISHSNNKSSNRNSEILKCAQEALDMIETPTVETIRRLLLAIDRRFSPYDYESIKLALEWCQKHCRDSEHSDWISQMQKLIAFLG